MKPLFSIAIPTRNRPHTLFFSIKSVLESTESNFEVVVSDNGDNDLSRKVVERFPRDRVRYVRAPRPLSMTDNWSLALENCRGEYVTVIGDDDALMPRSLANARILIENTGLNVVSWRPCNYWWSDTIAYWNANLLFVTALKEIKKIESRSVLSSHFSNPTSFSELPQIYNSFVSRATIDRAKARFGSYFPIENSPDVVSGYVNLILESTFLFSEIPLSVRGNSGTSNGTALWYRKGGAEVRNQWISFEKEHADESKPAYFGKKYAGDGLTGILTNLKVVAFDKFSEDLKNIQIFSPADVVRSLARECLIEPESFDVITSDALSICERHGLEFSSFRFPERPKTPIVRQRRRVWEAKGNRITVTIDCDRAEIFDVCAAARLADSLIPDIV